MAFLFVNVQLFLLIALVWVLQTQVIYPIERTLLDPSWVAVASTLFLPAGFKVIIAVIMGWMAAPAILLSTIFGMWLHTEDLLFSSHFAVESTISLYIPILLIRFLKGGEQGVDTTKESMSLFRTAVVVTVIAAMLNAFFSTVLYGTSAPLGIWLHFLIGDLLGTITVVGMVVLFRQSIYLWIAKRLAR